MKMTPSHLLAAVASAILFCLSFMAAGTVAVSGAFMIAGLTVLALLARSLIRNALRAADQSGA